MQLEDCEIECSYHWRPEFSDVHPKLRVAFFQERLVVTKLDDQNEFPTNGLTVFAGPVDTPWRDVVRACADEDSTVCYVEDWIDEPGLVGPKDLVYSSQPGVPLQLAGLAWLGNPYSLIAKYLVQSSDQTLQDVSSANGSFLDCSFSIVQRIQELDWYETDADATPEDVLEDALGALVEGNDFLKMIRLN